MLAYLKIVTLYLKKLYSLWREGEASKDKIDARKTPRSVSLQGVKLRAVFTSAESDSTQCYLRGVWLHAVLACAKSISSIFSKNLNVVLSF